MPTFTDKMLKGLKPQTAGQRDVWDKVLPCFGVRVGRKAKHSSSGLESMVATGESP
jgi:hypothetical protein